MYIEKFHWRRGGNDSSVWWVEATKYWIIEPFSILWGYHFAIHFVGVATNTPKYIKDFSIKIDRPAIFQSLTIFHGCFYFIFEPNREKIKLKINICLLLTLQQIKSRKIDKIFTCTWFSTIFQTFKAF